MKRERTYCVTVMFCSIVCSRGVGHIRQLYPWDNWPDRDAKQVRRHFEERARSQVRDTTNQLVFPISAPNPDCHHTPRCPLVHERLCNHHPVPQHLSVYASVTFFPTHTYTGAHMTFRFLSWALSDPALPRMQFPEARTNVDQEEIPIPINPFPINLNIFRDRY